MLTKLVARLWDVTGGRITLDGVDVRDLRLSQLRQVVATAFEDPTLFSMSARENLTLGRPDASDAEIAEAIEVAQAQFVYDLPLGLDTRIGEQGMSLSGGQRQRLALARAVLAQPAVLVLDDTLSALDIHTEALVEEALQRVLRGVTGIVVAHRASTVLLADRVALLSGGTIAHVGTHAELLATVPEYRELLSAEFAADERLLRGRRPVGRAGDLRRQRRPGSSSGAASPRSTADESERLTRDFLRTRSRALLADLLRPYRRSSGAGHRVVLVENAARLSMPLLVPAASTTACRRSWPAAAPVRCSRSWPRCSSRCCSSRRAGSSSCASPAGSARRCCWSCGAGCSPTSSGSTCASTTATPPAGSCPG